MREKTVTRQLTFSLTEEEYAYVKSKGRGYLRDLVQRAMYDAQAEEAILKPPTFVPRMTTTKDAPKRWWVLW
jgi:hypothetical protein